MKKLIIMLSLIAIPMSSQAGILLEPYIGMNATVSEYNTTFGKAGEAVAGTIMGFRAGLTFTMFFAAFDYHTGSNMDYDTKDSSGNTVSLSGDLARTGLSLGANLPVLPFRFWLGYYTGNVNTSNAATRAEFKDGSGTKLGVGFTGIPFIDINVEMFTGSFDDLNITGLATPTSNSADETGVNVSIGSTFSF